MTPTGSIVRPGDTADNQDTSIRTVLPSERNASLRLMGLGVALSLAWLPAVFGFGAVADVANLRELGNHAHPYFQPDVGGLLYLWTPIVVLSSFILFLSPGGLFVLAFRQCKSLSEGIVLAFASSLLFIVVVSTSLKVVWESPLSRNVLLWSWMTGSLLAFMLVVWRYRRACDMPRPWCTREDLRRLLWLGGLPILGVGALVPKVFWENFNVDGIEAFEFGRSLTHHLFPYWEIHEGVFGLYHNFVLFAYPNHWFITLFGPYEAAARIPYFLYLMVIFCCLIVLIELNMPHKLTAKEEGALVVAMGLYTVVQAYNTNYDPFFADLAENAATDTLAVLCFLSACWSLLTRRIRWFVVFGLMTHLASPGGLLLLGVLGVALFFSQSPNRMDLCKAVGGVCLVCVLLAMAYESLYQWTVLGDAKNQFSGTNMVKRLYPPTITEFVRFNALVFPCGVVPALSILWVRKKDVVCWVLAGVTGGVFGILYLQAWTSLHQFTLIMVLPLVIFWRLYLHEEGRLQRWLFPLVLATTSFSIWLSLPQHFLVNHGVREFGWATSYRIGNYREGYEEAVQSSSVLSALMPHNYRLQYPNQPWGFDPLSWVYYATREKPPNIQINYVVQSATAPPPPHATKIVDRDGVSVFVRDREAWNRELARAFPKVVVSPLYEPILHHTYKFFRDYVASQMKKDHTEGGVRSEAEQE